MKTFINVLVWHILPFVFAVPLGTILGTKLGILLMQLWRSVQ